MKITFDPPKREATLYHRGLDMAQVGEVFAGSYGGIGLDKTRRRHADHHHEESQ